MNLALDFGNTRIKAALFEGSRLVEQAAFMTAEELPGHPLIARGKNAIICSVTHGHEKVMEHLKKTMTLRLFMPGTPVPVKNLYQSALTLGSDRLAAAVGACNLYPNSDVLCIDAGTCIKYNFVNRDNEYLGGAIAPGITMRLKAMNHYTDRLPLADAEPGYSRLIGRNTMESLLSGAVTAAACEADGMIGRYLEDYPDLIVVVTGGDAPYLCSQLKNSFFAQQNLLLQGLNAILQFNLEK
jgi:type III pantothenate kinase